MRWGSSDFRELVRLRAQIERLEQDRNEFLKAAAKELAARLLREVIMLTPVGQYPPSSGKVGGTLRRGWTGNQSAAAYAAALPVQTLSDGVVIDIINPVEYAAYVEFGHRTVNGGWVDGRFMMTNSEIKIAAKAPKIIEKKLQKWLERNLND